MDVDRRRLRNIAWQFCGKKLRSDVANTDISRNAVEWRHKRDTAIIRDDPFISSSTRWESETHLFSVSVTRLPVKERSNYRRVNINAGMVW